MAKQDSDSKGMGRLLLGVALLGVLGLVAVRFWNLDGTTSPGGAATNAAPGNELVADSGLVPETEVSPFHKLEGSWLRPDGGYILEVRDAGADGRVQVSYLNPRPIHVSRAEVSEDGDRMKLMVELQDTGYPGCVYTLHYDAEQDIFTGTYYQAAMGETWDVVFTRNP